MPNRTVHPSRSHDSASLSAFQRALGRAACGSSSMRLTVENCEAGVGGPVTGRAASRAWIESEEDDEGVAGWLSELAGEGVRTDEVEERVGVADPSRCTADEEGWATSSWDDTEPENEAGDTATRERSEQCDVREGRTGGQVRKGEGGL